MQDKAEKKKFVDPVEKDDLLTAVRQLENLQYLLGDIREDYFNEHDIGSQKGRDCILFNFNRYWHYMEMACDLLAEAVKELHDNGIWCYERS